MKLKDDGYIDNPRLENEDELYYEGAGTTWGIDLDGNRYWKRYSSCSIRTHFNNDSYSHLSHGDIINEKARVRRIVAELFNEL